MSRTEIYVIGGKNPRCVGETSNAWRGAMYVWSNISKKYFNLEHFPMFDQAKQIEVWNADTQHDMPDCEKIVLRSTMDKAVISNSRKDLVIKSFEEYGKQHPNSSIGEQADIIKTIKLEDDEFIAFNQTSVSDFWGRDWDEEQEEYLYYNPNTGDKHFEI